MSFRGPTWFWTVLELTDEIVGLQQVFNNVRGTISSSLHYLLCESKSL